MFFSERSIRGRGIRFECYPERDAEGNSSALGEIVQELRLFSLQRWVAAIMSIGNKAVSDD